MGGGVDLGELGGGGVVAEESLHGGVAGDVVGERKAGVGEDGKIGAGGKAVGCVLRVSEGGVNGGEIAGEVTASGEAPHADFGGVERELVGLGAEIADGAGSIEEWGRVTVGRGKAVLEDVGGHAVGVEPAGFDVAFLAHDELGVAAAGHDDDGGVRAGAGGGVGVEAGNVAVGEGGGEGHVTGGPEGQDGGVAGRGRGDGCGYLGWRGGGERGGE